MPHLKPVGHQSTNWMVRLVLMVATAAFTSFGTTSPGPTKYVLNQVEKLKRRRKKKTWVYGYIGEGPQQDGIKHKNKLHGSTQRTLD